MANSTDGRDGVVSPLCLYTSDGLKKALGITESTIREAVRHGLTVHLRHKKRYIRGIDWINYVTSKGGLVQTPQPA